MEEKVEKKEGISIKEIFKTLLKKIRLLLLVLLAGVVVGAGFGFLTNFNKKYYGTTIEFYVNPVPTKDELENDNYFAVNGTYTRNVMDGLVKLLSSDAFAERLLMDKDGLPYFLSSENKTAIEAKMLEAKPYIEAVKDAEEAVEVAKKEYLDAQKDYTSKNSVWSSLQSEIRFANDTGNVSIIPTLQAKLETAKTLKEEAKAAVENKEEAVEVANESLKNAKADASEKKEKVYELYRKTGLYRSLIQSIRSSVSFSWYKPSEAEDLETIARSFIYVSIQVKGDEKLANDLYDQILHILPTYVSNAMPKPGGFQETECGHITRLDEVSRLNENQALTAAVKYGLLVGFVAVAAACIWVIVVDKKRKNKAQ